MAEDEANKYNYSTAQGGKSIDVKPGGSSSGLIYFYNVDGNRITHVEFSPLTTPEGWTVTFDPPVSVDTVQIGGLDVTVRQNLYVIPTEVQEDEITDPPSGYVNLDLPNKITVDTGAVTGADSATILIDNAATFITDGVEVGDRVFDLTDNCSGLVSSIDSETQITLEEALDGGTDDTFQAADEYRIARIGYALAKVLRVIISAPDSAVIGTSEAVTVHSVATWLGQTGSAITQERDFSYTINVTPTGSDETIPGEPFDWNRWLPVILAGGIGIVVLGIIYVPKLIAKRRKSV
ncbi:hypothetical protein ACFLVR_04515 [Chloroflexota bacterium]